MVVQFFIVFKDYLIGVLPFLAIGFLLSGLVHQFLPLVHGFGSGLVIFRDIGIKKKAI